MKRLISIFLVLMLVFNSAGYLILFYQLKKHFKKEAFSKLENFIDTKDLVEINVSKSNYENEDENFHFVEPHEIKYYGKMYDIARTEYKGDTVKIYALSDENEDNLHNFFALFLYKNLSDKYSRAAGVIHSIIMIASLPSDLKINAFFTESAIFIFILLPDLTGYQDIPTPPPKFSV